MLTWKEYLDGADGAKVLANWLDGTVTGEPVLFCRNPHYTTGMPACWYAVPCSTGAIVNAMYDSGYHTYYERQTREWYELALDAGNPWVPMMGGRDDAKKPEKSGATCKHCLEWNEYAEPGINDEFTCYACRQNPWRPRNRMKNDNSR